LEPSNSSRSINVIALLDKAVLFGIASGLLLYVMPFWREGRLRFAFWLTLTSTLLHVYTAHKRSGGTR
jgi:hypothetical protein